VLATARVGTVNFHPALLPINRGWYPHVHNILDGSPAGVTLHAMDAGADTGPIWAQRMVEVRPTDVASTLYERLQDEIVDLFRETWPQIVAGEIAPHPQREESAIYHRKSEIDHLDQIDLDAPTTARQVIDRLRARTFGERGFAWFETDARRIHVRIELTEAEDPPPSADRR